MSLNGLDDVKVKEAYDAAIAEPGGWFLLKYVARDEVDVLGRGNGGIVEIRNAIAKYEEDSPLFGILRYRRRTVILKYVPDGCSRLVKARVTVHFNAVTERFLPHDTIFPITTSKELRDSTLSAACSLHTASGSLSSSTSSLRRRRLMEIAEDAEEDQRQSILPDKLSPITRDVPKADSQLPQSSTNSSMQSPDLPSSMSYGSMVTESDAFDPSHVPRASENRPRSPTKSIGARRQSSQSNRPDIYSSNSYGSNGKPKVKLGPRPSLDSAGRSHTSPSSTNYRPVSTLPAGLKLFSRTSKKSKERPQSQHPSGTPSMTISAPPIPDSLPSIQPNDTPARPHTSGGRPTTSSVLSSKGGAMSPTTPTPKTPAMTPEKARLMKALQLRKKQMTQSHQPTVPAAAPQVNLSQPAVIERPISRGAPKEVEETLTMLHDMAKADSGIAIEPPSFVKVAESDSDITRTNSIPASPVDASEEAESTNASSVSEVTDETVTRLLDKHMANEAEKIGPKEDLISQNSQQLSDVVKNVALGRDQESQLTKGLAADTLSPIQELSVGAAEVTDPVSGVWEIDSVHLKHDDLPEPGAPKSKELPLLFVNDSPQETSLDNWKANEQNVDNAAPAAQEEYAKSVPEVSSVPNNAPQEDVEQKAAQKTPPNVLSREWKLPRSKFSVQDLKACDTTTSSVIDLTTSNDEIRLAEVPKSPVDSTFSYDTKRSITEDDQENESDIQTRKKRRGLVEPIRTDLSVTDRSAPNSEADFLSDDDLMDELQSATFQEAKPISVSKSPITPVFPTSTKKYTAEENRFSRSFSNPSQTDNSQFLSPKAPGVPSRSVSASSSYLDRVNLQAGAPMAKTVNLGSGISQRIKALEKLSSSTSSLPGTTASTVAATFHSVGKQGISRGSRSPSIAERANSLTRNTPSPAPSRDSSPETFKLHGRSDSVQSRRGPFNTMITHQQPRARPESISVTARIIRDPNQPFPSKPEIGKDPVDYAPLDLKQSPLVIDHQKAIAGPPKDTLHERPLSNAGKEMKRERRSSITIVKDLIHDKRNSFAERRKSMNIEPPTPSHARSSSRPPSTQNNSPSVTRPTSVGSRRSSRDNGSSLSPPNGHLSAISSSGGDENSDKKSNRASRMLRRMSSSLTASRKSLAHAISPTVQEESEPVPMGESLSSSRLSLSSMTAIEIGDVNVQFPDTLLWKRRSISVDSQGFLVVTQAQSNRGMEKSTGVKRYHLSEFRTPFVPEMEAQELPNSVVLDFVEGGGLQVACEDRSGQMRILHVLQEAHRSWASYGQ